MNRKQETIWLSVIFALACFVFVLLLAMAIQGCGGGGGDSEDPETPTNQTTSNATDALCVFTADAAGNFINLGEFTGEPDQVDELARIKIDYFIASCTGDVNITINQTTTTTTTEVPSE